MCLSSGSLGPGEALPCCRWRHRKPVPTDTQSPRSCGKSEAGQGKAGRSGELGPEVPHRLRRPGRCKPAIAWASPVTTEPTAARPAVWTRRCVSQEPIEGPGQDGHAPTLESKGGFTVRSSRVIRRKQSPAAGLRTRTDLSRHSTPLLRYGVRGSRKQSSGSSPTVSLGAGVCLRRPGRPNGRRQHPQRAVLGAGPGPSVGAASRASPALSTVTGGMETGSSQTRWACGPLGRGLSLPARHSGVQRPGRQLRSKAT